MYVLHSQLYNFAEKGDFDSKLCERKDVPKFFEIGNTGVLNCLYFEQREFLRIYTKVKALWLKIWSPIHFFVFQSKCPGDNLIDFPGTEACRILTLSDGTILNQSPVGRSLCKLKSLKASKFRIAKDFQDGNGETFTLLKLDFCKTL